jgi:hypothetical protein
LNESQLNFPMASKIKDQIFLNEWMNEMSGKRLGDVVALWRVAVCSDSGSGSLQWQFAVAVCSLLCWRKGRRYWLYYCWFVNCGLWIVAWFSVWLAVCFPQLSVSTVVKQSKELNKVPLVCYSSPVFCCVVCSKRR